MNKRGRSESPEAPSKQPRVEASNVDAMTVRAESACALIREHVSGWKDQCGAKYSIKAKLKKDKDFASYLIGFFDEIPAKQIVEILNIKLPGLFAVTNIECELSERIIAFKITRATQQRSNAPTLRKSVFDPNEAMRLRIAFDVRETDAQVVQEAIASVVTGFETAAHAKLKHIGHRPSLYVVHLSVHAKLTLSVIRAMAQYDGTVDFDNSSIVLLIPKSSGDID